MSNADNKGHAQKAYSEGYELGLETNAFIQGLADGMEKANKRVISVPFNESIMQAVNAFLRESASNVPNYKIKDCVIIEFTDVIYINTLYRKE